jgi:hypothetical protein
MTKEVELECVKWFAAIWPGLGIQRIIEHESPDALCEIDRISTGIEVTEYFSEPGGRLPPQAIDGYREKLAAEIKKIHQRRGLAAGHVSVDLYSDEALRTRKKREQLRDSLLELVDSDRLKESPRLNITDPPEALHRLGVGSVRWYRFDPPLPPSWSFPHAAFSENARPEQFQRIFDKKALLEPQYRLSSQRVWLLIVSGMSGLSSIADITAEVTSHKYFGPFDRVFIFSTVGGEVHELGIEPETR